MNVCCVDSIEAYFLIFIEADASARFLPIGPTSSSTNVQSLSSISCVLGSLKRVTVIAWLSGIGQSNVPTSGSTTANWFHASALDTTRRERLVQTICRFVGRLRELMRSQSRYYHYLRLVKTVLPFRSRLDLKFVIRYSKTKLICTLVDALQSLPDTTHVFHFFGFFQLITAESSRSNCTLKVTDSSALLTLDRKKSPSLIAISFPC